MMRGFFPNFWEFKRIFVSKFLRTYKDPSLVSWIGEFKRSLLEVVRIHPKDGDFIFSRLTSLDLGVLPSPWKSKGFYRRMNKAMLWSAWWNSRDF